MLTDDIRYQILKELEASPNCSQRELARKLGFSLGKTNFCLKALIEAGWIKVGNFARSSNKLRYAYVLTPKGLKEKAYVTLRFLEQKQRMYEQLEMEISDLKKEIAKRHTHF